MTAGKASHVGARLCVDAFVFCTWAGRRWLAMVDRADGLGWAVPGGGIKPGEFPDAAVVRELEEETGLVLDGGVVWRVLEARRVPDPRETPQAWFVTVPHVHDMGPRVDLPELRFGAEVRQACWVWADTFADLANHIENGLGGDLFTAHEAMIRDVIANL